MFIHVEYLIAYILIDFCENKNIDFVSIESIYNLGNEVKKDLMSQGYSPVIFLYSDIYLRDFLLDYSDLFEKNADYIKIRQGITSDDIREHILSYVPSEILFSLQRLKGDNHEKT